MQKIPVKFRRVDNARSFTLPAKATPGAAAYDIYASLPNRKQVGIPMGYTMAIPTNLSVEILDGWEIIITPRSGLAQANICVLNSPGTIDSDYRGEIKVLLHNANEKIIDFHSKSIVNDKRFEIKDGDRIAQLKIKPVYEIEWMESQNLSMTIRGDHGFGSTGV